LILLLVMLLRPQGLFGGAELGFLRARIWPKKDASAEATGDLANGSEQDVRTQD